MNNSEISVFVCGTPKDHKCDDNGKVIYGLLSGEITEDENRAKKEGCSWGSVTCSICGMSAHERAFWEGP